MDFMDALGTRREYMRCRYGKTINFIAPGVERQPRRQRGLLYGTESDLPSSQPGGRRHGHMCTDQR